MGSIIWDREVAEVYDQAYRAKFEPSVLGPAADRLAGLASPSSSSSLVLSGGFAGPGRLAVMPRGRRIGRPGGLERQGCGVSPGTVMPVSFDLPASR
jgi:hypothetical protein